MKRKSILLVLCIGMVLTSCKNIKTLNDSDVKNEKSQKKTVMEIQDISTVSVRTLPRSSAASTASPMFRRSLTTIPAS